MTEEHIRDILQIHWGIESRALEPMEGYESKNYRVISDQGKYVLKIYPIDSETLNIIAAENEVLTHLQESPLYPKVLSNHEQKCIIMDDGESCCYR